MENLRGRQGLKDRAHHQTKDNYFDASLIIEHILRVSTWRCPSITNEIALSDLDSCRKNTSG